MTTTARVLRTWILPAGVTAILVAVLAHDSIAQDPAYHAMADTRTLLGIPNALNVISNLPFVAVGIFGLIALSRRATAFHDRWERWPYLWFFGAVILTAFGSAYYHLAPDNARLVWDRLPMTIAFMALLSAVTAERLGVRIARPLLGPSLLLGATSIAYWYWTEVHGVGDLRLYILVQFGSLLVILLLIALYPARYSGSGYIFAGVAAYAAAKLFEIEDERIFRLGKLISGHTLKHLAAAGAMACVAIMLRNRIAATSARAAREKILGRAGETLGDVNQ
jgi:predicted membrane channel-forming protein YqfA (hemolysin III family)